MTDYKSRFKKIPVIRDRYARIAQYEKVVYDGYSDWLIAHIEEVRRELQNL